MHSRERATFDAAELAVVLSHYDLGILESITDFPRGSRKSPKVGIVSDKGKFLLKRRSTARAQPDRVRVAHHVQTLLASGGFPLAKLIATRVGRETLVQLRGHVYELFEFVAGQPFERSVEETRSAGEKLARFHDLTEPVADVGELPLPVGTYHDATPIRTGLHAIGSTFSSHDSFAGNEAELLPLMHFLLEAYDRAAAAADALGVAAMPARLIHADWHPGNMLFRQRAVAVVVDYDSIRISQRLIDVANGVLQFSIIAGGDPVDWPDHLDEARYKAFLEGYSSHRSLAANEIAGIPHLMAEALIAEAVPPITETGSVGRWSGFRVLQMIRRKLVWLERNAQRLSSP